VTAEPKMAAAIITAETLNCSVAMKGSKRILMGSS
jgi:hypothetical protein